MTSDFVKMGRQKRTGMFNGCRTDESKVRGSPRQNPKKIWQKMRSHEKCERVGDSKRFWRSDEQVGRLVKDVSRIKGVLKISVRVEGFDVFFEKKTQQEILCVKNTNAPAEKLELIKREFEELGSTSREYETYTHPKPDSSESRIARCNRRLCFRMEKELAEVKRLSKDEHIVASAAGREGDSLRKDDILLNGSVDSQDSNISNPVEILSQSVEKTKQEIVDHADAVVVEPSESKEKCTEKEFDATLKKCDAERVDVVSGGEEQPVGQEDFVHQLAKQEAVPKASEQKVFKEDDELEKKVQRMLKGIVDRWEKSTGKKF